MRGLVLRVGRLSTYFILTLLLMPVQAVLVMLGSRGAVWLPRVYHRVCCRLLGFKIEIRGRRSQVEPTLFVANHSSYADIFVLGALLPGSFVAKLDMRNWPFFGWLARLQRTVFVDRRTSTTREQRKSMEKRLESGGNLILFPEGTSNDGSRVLPFKSALFSAAGIDRAGTPLVVQPVSVAYTRLDGMPIGRFLRPFFAWYGDMELMPHVWTLVGLGTVTVVVEFHHAVTLAEKGSRKALAEHCRKVIAAGVSAALSGRQPAPEAAVANPLPVGNPAMAGAGAD
jgi:lyso-ornithine lipid O-acyltransferase